MYCPRSFSAPAFHLERDRIFANSHEALRYSEQRVKKEQIMEKKRVGGREWYPSSQMRCHSAFRMYKVECALTAYPSLLQRSRHIACYKEKQWRMNMSVFPRSSDKHWKRTSITSNKKRPTLFFDGRRRFRHHLRLKSRLHRLLRELHGYKWTKNKQWVSHVYLFFLLFTFHGQFQLLIPDSAHGHVDDTF